MGFEVGSVFARLGAIVDRRGFEQFDHAVKDADRRKVEAALGGDFNHHAFDQYDKAVKESRATAERRSKLKTQLGADFDPKGFRAYEKAIKDQSRGIDENVKAQGRMRTSFGSLYGRGGAMFAAAGGAYGLVTAIKSVTSAYSESQVSQVKMAAQLKALGIDYDAHSKQIDKVIQKTSKLAGLDDEDLQDAFTNIVRATGSVSESLGRMNLVADLARAKHLDVAKAGQLVGKVFGGNVSALSRYGITFDAVTTSQDKVKKSTDAQIEALTKQARTLKGPARQAVLDQITDLKKQETGQLAAAKASDKQLGGQKALDELQRKLSGQAAAYGKTQQGSVERLQVAWENLRETLGQKLAPTLTKAANKAADFVNQMQDGTGSGGRFVQTLKNIGEKVQSVAHFFKDHTTLIKIAAAAWVSYKVAALASVAASKAAGAAAVLGGRGAAGAGAAGAAGGAAGTVGRAGRLGGLAGGVAGAVVVAGGANIAAGLLKGPSGPDTGLLNKYADALLRVTKAGDSAGMHKLANQLRDTADANHDLTKGTNLRNFADALDDTASKGGKNISSIADAFSKLEKSAGGSIESVRSEINSLAKTRGFDETSREVDKAAANFADWRRTGSNNMKGLKTAVTENAQSIKEHLGKDTADGKDALAKNFRLARTAIRQAMDDGKVSVKSGLAEIQSLMRAELKQYGITGKTASAIIKHGDIKNDRAAAEGTGGGQRGGRLADIRAGRRGLATGGWIGAKGQVSEDFVPIGDGAIAALGEYLAVGPGGDKAVLNRHQAPIANMMLAAGGWGSLDTIPSSSSLPILEQAMAPIGGLDALFAAVTRPHYYAAGGAVGAANKLDKAHFPYLWGGGHQATPAPFGPMDCSGAVSYVLQNSGVNIPTSTSGSLMNMGASGAGPITVFANPEHTFMRIGARFFGTSGQNPGGGAGWFDNPGASYISRFAQRHFAGSGFTGAFSSIKAPQTGATGALGAIAQGALNVATAGANRFADSKISALGVGTGDAGDPGPAVGGAARTVIAKGLRLAGIAASAANIGKMLTLLSKENRGGSPTATNPTAVNGEHATGFLQMLPSTFRSYAVPGHTNINNSVDNAAASARYQMARYGHLVTQSPYSLGGIIKRLRTFAKGGRSRSGVSGDTKGDIGTSASFPPFSHWLVGNRFPHRPHDVDDEGFYEDFSNHLGKYLNSPRGKDHKPLFSFPSNKWTTGKWPKNILGLRHDWLRRWMGPANLRAAIQMGLPPEYARGGLVGFASGGKSTAKSSKKLKLASGAPHISGSGPQAGSNFTGFRIAPLANLNRGRSDIYDAASDHVEDLESKYANKDRLFNLSVEEFTNDDGSVNTDAVNKRVKQLGELLTIRKQIVTWLHAMRTLAERMRKTYRTIITRLKSAMRHTRGKSRDNYKTELDHYQTALSDVSGDLTELRRDKIPNAEIDVVELSRELSTVANTTADPGDVGGDTSPDTGTDAGAADTTPSPDAQAQIDQLSQKLANATESGRVASGMLAAFSSSGDIGMGAGGGSALAAARGNTVGVAGGVGEGGVVIIQHNSMMSPSDPAVLRQLASSTVQGMGYQPAVPSSTTNLGI